MTVQSDSLSWALVGIVVATCVVVLAVVYILGWQKKWHQFRNTTVTHLVWSPLVIWYVLLSYRLSAGIFSLMLLIMATITMDPAGKTFIYYSVWNFNILIVYFFFLSSIQIIHHYYGVPERLVLLVGNTAVVIFNVLVASAYLAMSFAFVIVVAQNLEMSPADTPPIIFIISFIAGILMFIEFALCNVPIVPFHANFMVTWAVVYAVFSWIFFAVQDEWIYPFLDISSDFAVLYYILLLVIHFVFFVIAYSMFRIKINILKRVKPGFDGVFQKVEFSGEEGVLTNINSVSSSEERFYERYLSSHNEDGLLYQ